MTTHYTTSQIWCSHSTSEDKYSRLTHMALLEGQKEKTLLKDNKPTNTKHKNVQSLSRRRQWWRLCFFFFPLRMEQLKTRSALFSATRIHTLQTCACTHVIKHTQGLVSIFRTSLGIWCLKLEGHFVKQISACWKKIKTCCPCVSISVRACGGGFISFYGTLWVCAKGTCFNFRTLFLSFFTPVLK